MYNTIGPIGVHAGKHAILCDQCVSALHVAGRQARANGS